MKRKILIGSFLLCVSAALGQISPFNGLRVAPPEVGGEYRMILSGHLHGASNDISGFPASTVLANIELINDLGADVFLSTGDLFLDPEREHDQYRNSFFRKLEVPLFNAVGNHDKGPYYESHFGTSNAVIAMGGDRIVLLDTERKNGSLDKDQLQLLDELVNVRPTRIFIISHRPLWAEGSERYGPLFEGNTRAIMGTNHDRDVWPRIQQLAQHSEVFWVSGSMAGAARSSIFFQPHASNITFIQTAIRNEPRDALLIADVRPGGIDWSAVSLTGQDLLEPEAYDADWWWAQRKTKEPFNWRLLPYLISVTLQHPAFWYGALAGVLVVLGFRRLFRRGL